MSDANGGAPVRPFMYRLLVQLLPEVKQVGGILLPPSSQYVQRNLAMVAKVITVGPAAFSDEKFGGDKVQAGQFVLLSKYKGAEFEVKAPDQAPYRMINDDEILGVIENPDFLKRAV